MFPYTRIELDTRVDWRLLGRARVRQVAVCALFGTLCPKGREGEAVKGLVFSGFLFSSPSSPSDLGYHLAIPFWKLNTAYGEELVQDLQAVGFSSCTQRILLLFSSAALSISLVFS